MLGFLMEIRRDTINIVSDESAVHPAALVEPLGVDPGIACVLCFVEIMEGNGIVAHDLDHIIVIKLANLVPGVIAGLGAECKPSGLQSMDCFHGAFLNTDLAVSAAGYLCKFLIVHLDIFVCHDLNLLYYLSLSKKVVVLFFRPPHLCGGLFCFI